MTSLERRCTRGHERTFPDHVSGWFGVGHRARRTRLELLRTGRNNRARTRIIYRILTLRIDHVRARDEGAWEIMRHACTRG